MKITMAGAVLAAAIFALPGAALAQTMSPEHGTMAGEHGTMTSGHMAAMICRPAAGTEHGNAMMTGSRQMLMCKTLAPGMAEGKAGPDISKALSPAEVNAAWQRWVNAQFEIPATGGG